MPEHSKEQWWSGDGGDTTVVAWYDLDGTAKISFDALQMLLTKAGFELTSETPFKDHADA